MAKFSCRATHDSFLQYHGIWHSHRPEYEKRNLHPTVIAKPVQKLKASSEQAGEMPDSSDTELWVKQTNEGSHTIVPSSEGPHSPSILWQRDGVGATTRHFSHVADVFN